MKIIESNTSPEAISMLSADELADRVLSFLDRHAGIAGDYDPDYDDPAERFSGPDATLLNQAAELLRDGQTPNTVHSDWGSGTYRPFRDMNAKAEHDALVQEINNRALGPK